MALFFCALPSKAAIAGRGWRAKKAERHPTRDSIVIMNRRLIPLVLLLACPLVTMAKENLGKYVGIYKGETRARDETREQSREGDYAIRHHTIALSLGKDGTATLTQSPDGATEITSFAHWSHEGELIKLQFDPVDKQATPPPASFRVSHSTLTPVLYNHDLWRSLPPPPLHRQKARDPGND